MNIYRRLLVYVLILICSSAISATVWLATLQTTILNRATVKTWLQHSGIYATLVDSLVQTPNASDAGVLGGSATKQALKNTFTPSFTQQQTERAADGIYDWLDGKAPSLTFTIALGQQKGQFAQQLRSALEPTVAALPVCTPMTVPEPDKLTCRPPTLSASALADNVAQQVATNQDFFNTPITVQGLPSAAGANQSLAAIKNLPTYRQWITRLLWILPLAALLCAGCIYAAAPNRAAAYRRLLRHIWVSSLITLLLALGLLYLSTNLSAIPAVQSALAQQTSQVLVPLLEQIVQGIGSQLALFSGIVAVVGFVLWFLLRNRPGRPQLQPVVKPRTPVSRQSVTKISN